MSTDPNRQGHYPPPHWSSQPGQNSYPPPHQSQYPDPTSSSGYQYPHPPPSSDMQTLPPQAQDQYRLPGPHTMYPHPQDYRSQPPPQPMNYPQPAPRQRTAIACRYCRRRKIRCSGFDASEDGRCTNCVRFNQECMFTPVSSQAQAFVPAHTAYPHLRNTGGQPRGGGRQIYPHSGPPVLYGAHGQPLGPVPDPSTMQSPGGYYPPQYGLAPAYDDRGPPPPSAHPQDQVSRKRPRLDDPHTPVLAPVYNHSTNSPSSPSGQQRPGRRGSGSGYEYPDPTNLAPNSPATSVSSYQSHPNTASHPYYAPAPQPRRSSPQSYPYDNRASDSPHGSVSSSSGQYQFPNLHPPQVLPPTRDNGRTPPPPGGRMSVQQMLGPGDNQGGRTNADSEMLNALNRKM